MERNEKKFKRKTVTMAQHKEESEMSQWTKYLALNTTLAFQWCRENSVSCMKFVRHRQWIVKFVLEVTEILMWFNGLNKAEECNRVLMEDKISSNIR
jgi:hypothetical protein